MVVQKERGDAVPKIHLRRVNSLRLRTSVHYEGSELGAPLRRTGSLRIARSPVKSRNDQNRLHALFFDARLSAPPSSDKSGCSTSRSIKQSTVLIDAPVPEYLARNLLQLGCPAVSMPRPRSGLRLDHPQSSDSDDSSTSQIHQHPHGQDQNHSVVDMPTVHVSGPSNIIETSSIINGSASAIGARSAPSTPLQCVAGSPQPEQQTVGGSQLRIGDTNLSQPSRSPTHMALKCSDSEKMFEHDIWSNDIWSPKIRKTSSQLSKPLSRSTPSMTAGIQTPAKVSRSSTRSSPSSTSSARQKKFHRHFNQVAEDERVLNYYSCALVGDILLQGHLYITPNYFAFYSNVFGYVTKLLIPTVSVLKISKEKTARIIPNAVAVATEQERHVFCSLLSRDSTFKLMKQVWDAALELKPSVSELPLPVETKLLASNTLLVDDSEVNHEEEESSMSESGTDLTSRPPTVCTDTDVPTLNIKRTSLVTTRLEQPILAKSIVTNRSSIFRHMFLTRLNPSTFITILVILLAALYALAALMMLRIDRLHTAYLNHPLVSSEYFPQDRLLHYLDMNLDQIVKVRQSLQMLSQQFITVNQRSEHEPIVSRNSVESDDVPS